MSSVDPAAGVQVIDKGIPELSVAKAHLASTLSGGVYTKSETETEGEYENVTYTDSPGETLLQVSCTPRGDILTIKVKKAG